jgi:hypothetical protein
VLIYPNKLPSFNTLTDSGQNPVNDRKQSQDLQMTSETSFKPLSTSDLTRPSSGFEHYCEAELERRKNSGEEFDEAAFLEAVELTVARLRMLEDEEQI